MKMEKKKEKNIIKEMANDEIGSLCLCFIGLLIIFTFGFFVWVILKTYEVI